MHRCGSGQLIGLVLGLSACGSTTSEAPTAETEFGLTASYVATEDDVILYQFPTANFGGAPTCGAQGMPLASRRSCLMRFGVPYTPNITVNSAWLDLRATDTTGQTYTVYRVLSGWSEYEATWNQRSASVPWEVAGAQGPLDRGVKLGAQTFNQPDQTFFFNDSQNGGVQMVQSWFTQPSTNFGVIIAHDLNDDRVLFATREHATPEYRPTLYVNYTLNNGTGGTGPGGAGGTGAGGAGGMGTGGTR